MYLESMDTVVTSDLHGQDRLLEKVIDMYPGVRIISNGDELDGDNPRALLEVGSEYGILRTVGNHEGVTRAVMLERDSEIKQLYQERWRHRKPNFLQYEYGTLKSYGVDVKLKNDEAAERLKDKMFELGHIALLKEAKLYYETDDYIVVHAGLTNAPWEDQKALLDAASVRMALNDYSSIPVQIMDSDYDLSNGHALGATDKIVISGHSHFLQEPERSIDNGKRIRLASKLAIGQPLYLWQSWDNQVVEVRQ